MTRFLVSAKKDRPKGRSFANPIRHRRSEILVRRVGRLVDGVLGGLFGIADGLLALALDFLHRAFALQLVGTDGLADALLGLADGLVGGALDLVCRCTHGNSPLLLSFATTTLQCAQSSWIRLVCDHGFLYLPRNNCSESRSMTGSHDHTHSDHSHDHG